ncbi:GIN domain-containing protein [Pedobacter endophyticus]|uniref:DUF2807 domain-containing protein n=1 Tax=Pedobacter endophyticus TaxID=2789740 RepID=A0A7U3Q3R7_9SPHI|nr:DUF2807 domain-containing protein [Pedobacter endophyticus]QPH37814.1 DUF2807 domain-containing protein [Pedobacter endophyticus]
MKTSIKTLIATSLTAIVLSTAVIVPTVSATEIAPIKKSKVSSFRKISVKGNVELTIVQGSRSSVAYADDNYGSAKVMQDGDNLKISSTSNELTKVVVYVTDIFRIQASENALVKTDGKLNTQFLQIFLNDNAHADIDTKTEGLYTVIEDHADLKLSGSTNDHTLVMGDTQKLTMDKFAALKTHTNSLEKAIETVVVAK